MLLERPLYIGTPSVYVHAYMLEIIYSHIDHTLWSTFVLVLSSTVLGESFPKEDSYMV